MRKAPGLNPLPLCYASGLGDFQSQGGCWSQQGRIFIYHQTSLSSHESIPAKDVLEGASHPEPKTMENSWKSMGISLLGSSLS
eukprot:scaffold5198_cov173-Amphora_coffeaeformis.AAC.12